MAKESAATSPYRVGSERTAQVIVTTSPDVPGCRAAEVLGVVRGIVVRSPTIGQGIMGSLRSIGGGNVPEFVAVCEQARHDAYVQMVEHAAQLGADGIVSMRYDATEFAQGITEVLAYGTAVRLVRV